MMLRLHGLPLARQDALPLVATLLADGGDLAVSAAKKIYKGIDEQRRGAAHR